MSARPVYSPQERLRRDSSPWTLVQGILAIVQLVIFCASLGLVAHYLLYGTGLLAADISVVVKTAALYTIMITGSVWEKQVFGRWLFAPSFFWEDAVSMVVIALHTAYLVMLLGGLGGAEERLWVALAGYAFYLVNAGQFLRKLRVARSEARTQASTEAHTQAHTQAHTGTPSTAVAA